MSTLAAVACHDHLCLIHESREELLEAIVPFFRHGLARGERCVYIGDAPPAGAEFDALVQAGLIVLGTRDAYLRGGRFELEKMLDLYREKSDEARRSGHAALRVAGEASWMLAGAPGVERFFEYESRVNELLTQREVLALCLYDRALFSAGHLRSVLRTHPLVIHRGAVCRNFHYEPPHEFLSSEPTSQEIDRRLAQIHEAQMRPALPSERDFQTLKLDAVGRLAGGIAHEFNNILTGLLGLSRFIEEDLPADSESLDDIRQITSLGKRASVLVNQLLAFAQRRHSQPRRMELTSALQASERTLRQVVGEDVGLAISGSEQPLFITADPEAIGQILVYLCANAREAMPGGGKLSIEVKAVKDYALLSVTDTGVGMSAETQALIFDPFFSAKDAFPRVGLGLSAVYGLVRQNGGFIEVLSSPDRGATFRIHFPLLTSEPAQA